MTLFRATILLLLISTTIVSTAQKPRRASAQRMESRINALAEFGKNPEGGVSRVAYSVADVEGRTYIKKLMEELGLVVRVDAGGNIIGRRKGKKDSLPVIAFGSHIDSVPMGGNYDGQVGVVAALECISILNDLKITTTHPLEVIVFADEEGSLVGSKAMNGTLSEKDLAVKSSSGKTIRQGLIDIGGDPDNLQKAKRSNKDIKVFLEMHIEQGAFLDRDKINIGVVEGIVGIEWWDVIFSGKANHAGTTPMDSRQDALLAAAKFISIVNEVTRSFEGRQVGTVGRISAEPGAPNVIPGRVVTSLEIRDLSAEKIMSVYKKIEEETMKLAKESNVSITFKSVHSVIPAVTDKSIQDMIAANAKKLGLSYQYMPSGAGHDTQDMAKIVPSAMVFVPSKDGISHSPREYTSAQDMANGASVLYETILDLDKMK